MDADRMLPDGVGEPVRQVPGMSLSELVDKFGTEARCEAALVRARWPSGFLCPVTRHFSYTGEALVFAIREFDCAVGRTGTAAAISLSPKNI